VDALINFRYQRMANDNLIYIAYSNIPARKVRGTMNQMILIKNSAFVLVSHNTKCGLRNNDTPGFRIRVRIRSGERH
jgi:hypothetical protein